MKLSKLHVENFKKLNNVDVILGDASFLIGANNSGKSSTLEAIEILITEKKIDSSFRSKYIEDGEEKQCQKDVIIEGEFTDVPQELVSKRGFNVRRINVYKQDGIEKYSFKYRVRLSSDNKLHREILMHSLDMKNQYLECTTYQQFIDKGVDSSYFEDKENLEKKLTPKQMSDLENFCPVIFDIKDEDKWFENPGGIPGNVISHLPRILKIKADVLSEEMNAGKSGALHDILDILFEDVREKSQHYKTAVDALSKLEKEMDAKDPNTEFGKMMIELNQVVDTVFHKASINVETELTKPENLKANFSAYLKSNVETPVDRQGTGLIRATVFALLQYKKQREENENDNLARGLIITFEEPELFLHPNAAEKMRDLIYDLVSERCQIVATTHSPYMVNIEKLTKQVLNSYKMDESEFALISAFNISDAFKRIEEDDKVRVKMVQKIDDYVSRVFFAQKVIIVEGDTEDIVFKHTINVMPEDVKKGIKEKYQIIKAVGKATMISFIKYLKALNVDVFVVHDEDLGTPGAEKMNEPILSALSGEKSLRLMMHNCIEDELGYKASSNDKPFRAYQYVKKWEKWEDVPDNWKENMRIIFSEFSSQLE